MSGRSKSEIARASYAAFMAKDRARAEALLTEDFTFTSPYDDAIDRAAYFERCWPTSETVETFDIERIVEQGSEVFVLYRLATKDGKVFRNTEFLTFEGDRIKQVSVYFGATSRYGKFVPAREV